MIGHALGTLLKEDLVGRLQGGVLGMRNADWLRKQRMPDLLAACCEFGVDDGLTEELLKHNLTASQHRKEIAPHGSVSTVKLYLRSIFESDQILLDKLDAYVQCWTYMHR